MNKILGMVLATSPLFLCNCQHSEPMNSRNQDIVKQYFDYFNDHDWSKMAEMYSEVAEFKDPSFGQGTFTQTRQQTVEKYSELSQSFPDLHDQIVQTYPSGERHIIVELVSSGTAPDGSRFELPICTVFTIEDGLITKDFTYYDNFEE